MKPELGSKIQFVLAIALLIAAARVGDIYYQRSHAPKPAKKAIPPLDPDFYVLPKKLYPYDLKSAQQLTKQPVWAKVGYSYTYCRYDRARHRTDFAHPAGLLLPIEKVQITDVVTDKAPDSEGERQIMAVFDKDGKTYAFSVGFVKGNDYHFYSDSMLFIQDPHDLYKDWPAAIWQAIDKHQAALGMSELQSDLAIGLGIPLRNGDAGNRTVSYPNGGHPLLITYQDGKAVKIKPQLPP